MNLIFGNILILFFHLFSVLYSTATLDLVSYLIIVPEEVIFTLNLMINLKMLYNYLY